jgi:hypothetical protein
MSKVIRFPAEIVFEILTTATAKEIEEVKNAAIHRLIKSLGGTQDPALGTVVCDLDITAEPKVRLWIHEWE